MSFTGFLFHPEISGLSIGPQVFSEGVFLGGPCLFYKTSVIPAFWLNAPTWHFAGSEKSHPRSMAPSEPDAIATSRAGMLLSLLPVPETLGFYSRKPNSNSVVLLPTRLRHPWNFCFPPVGLVGLLFFGADFLGEPEWHLKPIPPYSPQK